MISEGVGRIFTEYDIKDKENQTIQDQKNKHIQLALFPI
jgi:hypothetical protein